MISTKASIKYYPKDEIFAGLDAATDFLHLMGFSDKFGDVRQMISNSQGLALAYIDEEVAGVGRLIGDGVRYDSIADLNVRKRHRGLGLGRKLAIALASNSSANFVSLKTDPKDQGLREFYKKCGFVEAEYEYIFDWPKKPS